MNNKKTIIILILVLTIGIVGLTIAYFSNSTSVDNLFSTNPYGTTVEEVFVSPDNWLPGTTTEKLVTVTNTGLVDEAVRISYTEEWKAKAGTILSGLIDSNGYLTNNTENSERAAIINLSDNNDWTYSNGYYYYNYRLAPNETTSSLIDSVTFNSKVKSDSDCTTEANGSTKTVTCNSTNAGYDGAAYKLTFTIETVQYNKYKEAWGTNFAIANIKQQTMNVQQFLEANKNATDAEYNENTKSKMFEFNHPATIQTTELTDYRYIGEEPNNYIYFNCDNDGTNCEVWRIIGVFDVDDGTGNYEQRIKIVSGSAINKMEWDDRESLNNIGVNIWKGSKANIFLNNDYLMSSGETSAYGLKPLARTQIADAKYYLGGISKQNTNSIYGTTEDIYNSERGNDVISIELYCSDQNHSWFDNCKINYCENNPSSPYCNNIETSWVGKVGLIYPSDYAYTYSMGIDDTCYNNPYECQTNYQGNPLSGWIYRSNIGDYYQDYWYTWTITPLVQDTYSFEIDANGYVNDTYSGNVAYIRPAVYLKSDIEIYNGDGSEDNPYCLMEECSNSSSQLNKKIKYSGENYYIISEEDEYLTLLKEKPLTNIQINSYSDSYTSENGEYPYLENDNCNSSNISNCTINYDESSIKTIIDKWSSGYNNDLVTINGYKARLVNEDDINYYKNVNISNFSVSYYLIPYNNEYFFKSDPYWSLIPVDDSNDKILVIGRNLNLSVENVYNKLYIRPVINLKKCALTNTCE